jgi:hypothetical protein
MGFAMRSDMHKVIVERPRYGGRTARKGRVPRNPDSLPSPYGYFQAQLMHGMVGCMVSIADMADRAPRVLANNEVVDIGGKRILHRHAACAAWLGCWCHLRGDNRHAALWRFVHPDRQSALH